MFLAFTVHRQLIRGFAKATFLLYKKVKEQKNSSLYGVISFYFSDFFNDRLSKMWGNGEMISLSNVAIHSLWKTKLECENDITV